LHQRSAPDAEHGFIAVFAAVATGMVLERNLAERAFARIRGDVFCTERTDFETVGTVDGTGFTRFRF